MSNGSETLVLIFSRTQNVTADLVKAAALQAGFTKGQIKQMGGPTTMSRSQAESLLAMIDTREGSNLLSQTFTQGTGMVNGVAFAYVKVG